jgi:hypothetical protein
MASPTQEAQPEGAGRGGWSSAVVYVSNFFENFVSVQQFIFIFPCLSEVYEILCMGLKLCVAYVYVKL